MTCLLHSWHMCPFCDARFWQGPRQHLDRCPSRPAGAPIPDNKSIKTGSDARWPLLSRWQEGMGLPTLNPDGSAEMVIQPGHILECKEGSEQVTTRPIHAAMQVSPVSPVMRTSRSSQGRAAVNLPVALPMPSAPVSRHASTPSRTFTGPPLPNVPNSSAPSPARSFETSPAVPFSPLSDQALFAHQPNYGATPSSASQLSQFNPSTAEYNALDPIAAAVPHPNTSQSAHYASRSALFGAGQPLPLGRSDGLVGPAPTTGFGFGVDDTGFQVPALGGINLDGTSTTVSAQAMYTQQYWSGGHPSLGYMAPLHGHGAQHAHLQAAPGLGTDVAGQHAALAATHPLLHDSRQQNIHPYAYQYPSPSSASPPGPSRPVASATEGTWSSQPSFGSQWQM